MAVMARFVRRPRLTPRRLVLGWLVLAAVAVLGYLAVTAALARSDLQTAKSSLGTVKARLLAGDEAGARRELAAADRAAAAAQDRTRGPLWTAAAAVPFVGRPLDTVRGIARTAHELTTTTLPRVVDVAAALSPDRLRVATDRIDVAALANAAPTLAVVDTQVAAALRDADALPTGTWLSPVDRARTQFRDLVAGLHTTLDDASQAARLAPSMLGADGPRRYLLVIQTNAEARGLGGLPGVFAVVRADRGRVGFDRFGNDSDIHGHAHAQLGSDFVRWYSQFGVETVWENSNASPDFPADARIWLSMWQDQTGQRLDGAIATDPVALSYLLRVTGPVTLKDGTVVSADNIVELSESTAYARYRDTAERKRFFVDLGRATADHVLHAAGGHGRALIDAMAHAARERRIVVWSSHRGEQAQIAARGLGGVLPSGPVPFTATVVNNAAGSKLDYYLERTVRYDAGRCDGGRRRSTVTIELRNAAPAHGLPPYVIVRSDHPEWPPAPGTNRSLVTVYATAGSRLTGASVDGADVLEQILRGREADHPIFTTAVEIPPLRTVTLRFALIEPAVAGRVETLAQPLVRPLRQQISAPAC